ncbi:site-specific integrase [Vibrio parahaemolyticus]|uniref:site-specific integrase n=1 Tax=Vibrio parahaemolyticus TaxID=670 RepID=UPI000D738A63|nr:site-specific integrase [Vibrio parahaemolyticus]MBO0178395.1 site-specific integrase [Vibrio parahaemolyticus]MCR9647437.1 site-specific integrase [Vibrio parahaemolyticus]MCR9801771.1 site-specific integrase [Vibrio parahaemolyticus]MDF4282484.1 site-specific integrase [Vibrio parahaemolyticus]MDF4313630.1 site-specific integrase [Vibrio parahaemolyticus]
MATKKAAKFQALVKVVPTRINLGSHPEFVLDEQGDYLISSITSDVKLRVVKYKQDDVVERFPLLVATSRLVDILEMNLFLIHRYIGQYSIKRTNIPEHNGLGESDPTGTSDPGTRIDIATVEASAKHLAAFLRWLIDHEVNWTESLSEPLNDRIPSLESLPIWRFRRGLIDKVESGQLSYGYASNRLQVVKTFYEWAWKNHRIQSIPFKYITKTVRKHGNKSFSSSTSGLGNLLFGMGNGPTKKGGIPVFTTNLALPKKMIQKQASPEDGLQPYSLSELHLLISSDTLKKDNYSLWAELGYRCGLRTMDIVQLNYTDLHNPDVNPSKQFKITLLSSKGKKTRRFTVSRDLMKKLWMFVNTTEYAKRRIKYEIRHGLHSQLPVFINTMGDRIAKRSVSNVISIVRAEQKKKGVPVLKRTFHDLRATFGTYLACYMLEAGYTDDFIKVTLTRELGHNDFEISKRYLNFAKTDCAFSNVVAPWVTEMYKPLQYLLCKETEALVK